MAFTLFCCELGNVVNHAFLVLIFWVKKLVGANFTRFCNYVKSSLLEGLNRSCSVIGQRTFFLARAPAQRIKQLS